MLKLIGYLFAFCVIISSTKATEPETQSLQMKWGHSCLLKCRNEEFESCFRKCYRDYACPMGVGPRGDGHCIEPLDETVEFYIQKHEEYNGNESRKCAERNMKWYDTETFCPHYCGESEPQPCYKGRFTGCECRPGTVRREDGECVEPKYCQVFSGTESNPNRFCRKPNQEWSECGSACPLTCGEIQPKKCISQCIIGCQCKPGTIVNNDGECVEPKDCKATESSTTQKAHQPSFSCSNNCLITCRAEYFEPCFRSCYRKCTCKKSECADPSDTTVGIFTLIHEKYNGIGSETCNQRNQQWYGPESFCPRYCQETEDPPCYKGGKSGCSCKPGTVRRDDGECVEPKDC